MRAAFAGGAAEEEAEEEADKDEGGVIDDEEVDGNGAGAAAFAAPAFGFATALILNARAGGLETAAWAFLATSGTSDLATRST